MTVMVGVSDGWVDGASVPKPPVDDGVRSTSIVAGVVVQPIEASIMAKSSNRIADLLIRRKKIGFMILSPLPQMVLTYIIP